MSDAASITQEAIYAGLDAMLSVLDLDLCAYLHMPANGGPQLFLRRPDLGKMPASDAFNLFGSLRDALENGFADIAGYNVVLVPTAGSVSRGLHAVGRHEGKLDENERRIVDALARATAGVAHALEPEEQRLEPSRVSVEFTSDAVVAEVTLDRIEGQALGRAEAPTAPLAVARAALDALGGAYAAADVTEISTGGERGAVVLVEGTGARRIAAALAAPGRDPLFAFAVAALDAASRMPVQLGG